MFQQNSGAVYLFKASSGTQIQKYVEFIPEDSDEEEEEEEEETSAATKLRRLLGWHYKNKGDGNDDEEENQNQYSHGEFGISLAMSKSDLIVGADFALSEDEVRSGAVYMRHHSSSDSEGGYRYVNDYIMSIMVLLQP